MNRAKLFEDHLNSVDLLDDLINLKQKDALTHLRKQVIDLITKENLEINISSLVLPSLSLSFPFPPYSPFLIHYPLAFLLLSLLSHFSSLFYAHVSIYTI